MLDVHLQQGDVLYLPRGWPHEVLLLLLLLGRLAGQAWVPRGASSMHLTLGVNTHK